MSLLASTPVLSALTGLLSLWLGWRRRWLHLAALLAAMVSGVALNLTLKYAFVRPRPEFANAYYHETGFSFPSGHAMLAVVFYGLLAYLLVCTIPRWKWQAIFVLGAATLALLIGFSRLYLGVHYLTDVLGGWAAGSLWLAACITATEAAQYRAQSRHRSPQRCSELPHG